MHLLATWTSDDWVKLLVQLSVVIPIAAAAIIAIIKAAQAKTAADSAGVKADAAQASADSAQQMGVRNVDRIIQVATNSPPPGSLTVAPTPADQTASTDTRTS